MHPLYEPPLRLTRRQLTQIVRQEKDRHAHLLRWCPQCGRRCLPGYKDGANLAILPEREQPPGTVAEVCGACSVNGAHR